jgi:hypothetical protein
LSIAKKFQEEFLHIIANQRNIAKFESLLNEYSKTSFLAQGLLKMFEGHKKLNHEIIIKGLKLCRNDDLYHKDMYIQDFVNDISKNYVNDLREHDMPSAREWENEITLFACPSCGVQLSKKLIRGQVQKCDSCGRVFEVV